MTCSVTENSTNFSYSSESQKSAVSFPRLKLVSAKARCFWRLQGKVCFLAFSQLLDTPTFFALWPLLHLHYLCAWVTVLSSVVKPSSASLLQGHLGLHLESSQIIQANLLFSRSYLNHTCKKSLLPPRVTFPGSRGWGHGHLVGRGCWWRHYSAYHTVCDWSFPQ